MMHCIKKFSALMLALILVLQLSAQEIPSDIANISDQQLAALVTKYQLNGLSDAEFLTAAKQKGLSTEQALLLKRRIAEMDIMAGQNANFKSKTSDENAITRQATVIKGPSTSTVNNSTTHLKVFGSELFSKEGLNFEPNLNIATPKNYIIGAGDELLIDIYGLSESTKKLKVTTEGVIRFPNLGPIKVAGLTIEEAQTKIKTLAAKVYTTIQSGATNVVVSLGQQRSIRITMVGELVKPGNYTVSALSTIMNALYASGGPNEIGSFRKIELVRSGKTIVVFDLYDFLLRGDLSKNKLLQDEDVIRVGAYESRVAIVGSIKKQALFDLKKGETAAEVIHYAGDFSDAAYKEMIRVKRNGNKSKELISVKASQFGQFNLVTGDTLIVDDLATNYINRVTIHGAVYYPGEYGINQIATLKALLQTVQVKENAYTDLAFLRRFNDDLSPTMMNFNIKDVLEGKGDMPLHKEDSIYVYAKDAIREKYEITINGEVNQPGTYTYADNMHVQDLILMSGGFTDAASMQRIEVARRLRQQNTAKDSSAYSIIKVIDLGNASAAEDLNFVLAPFDVVSIRKSPLYKTQITVDIEGEVLFPGKYTLSSNRERLSDVILRAGGLKQTAYAKGAILLRKSTQNGFKPVGIRLNVALEHTGTAEDIILEQGDSVQIPKLIQTVSTSGAVNVPRQVAYTEGMSFLNAIRKSGWFVTNANRRHAYVIRANGEIKTTKRFLVFHFYPSITPGSEIVVPTKKPKPPVTTAEYIGIGSSIASLAGLIIALINATK